MKNISKETQEQKNKEKEDVKNLVEEENANNSEGES